MIVGSLYFMIPHYITRDGLCVLGYHGVVSDEDKQYKYKDDRYALSVSQFERQMQYLYKNKYTTYSMDDVYAYYNVYSEVIEMSISKYITHGNIFDFDVDSNGNMLNHSYILPYDYTPLEENYRHGIRIGYTQQEKELYYSTCNGLYVSKDREIYKATLDSKNLELVLKFNIKNN